MTPRRAPAVVHVVDSLAAATGGPAVCVPQLVAHLRAQQIQPRHRPDFSVLGAAGSVPVAAPYWDTLFS